MNFQQIEVYVWSLDKDYGYALGRLFMIIFSQENIISVKCYIQSLTSVSDLVFS